MLQQEEEEEEEGIVECGMNGRKARDVLLLFFGDDVQSDWHQHTHTDTETETQAMLVCGVLCVWSVWSVDEQQGLFGSEAGVVVVVVDGRGSTHTHTARAMGRAQQASKQAK